MLKKFCSIFLKLLPKDKYLIDLLLVYNEGIYLSDIPEHVSTNFVYYEETEATHKEISDDNGAIYKKFVTEMYDVEVAFLEGNATKILSASTGSAYRIAWVHIDLSKLHYTSALFKNIENEKNAYKAFDKIVFVSKGAKYGFQNLLGNDFEQNSAVIYNPIYTEEIIEKAAEFTVDALYPTFCAIGRLTGQKGFDRLINVVAELKKDGYFLNLWIIGEGNDKKILSDQIKRLGLCDYVKLLGFKNNPFPYLNAADAFVCSSRTEGFSLVICEAVVLKKPIISTNCTGAQEVLRQGKLGLIVDNDETGLYRGMKNFIANPPSFEYNLPSTEIRCFHFDKNTIIKQIDNLFSQLS